MKTKRQSSRGFTIIECIVYFGAYVILLSVAFVALYRGFNNMKLLHRVTDDITRTVRAGEIWRADVRAATQPIQFNPTEQTLRIMRADREIMYRFAEGQILRRSEAAAPWAVLLPNVRRSEMQADARAQVTAWRWEVELQTRQKNARLQPLFTFSAVPSKS